MQFKGFSGLRLYPAFLQRDMRELERYIRALESRLARITEGESLHTTTTEQGETTLGSHAATHISSGDDPITNLVSTWTARQSFSGGIVLPSGTGPTPAIEGALFLDTDLGDNGTVVVYSNGDWRTVGGDQGGDYNIDGGRADSIYTAEQSIDGGSA